jgi:hypothetical protein
MRRTLTATATALLLAGLAACSSSPKPAVGAQADAASQPLTASTALQQIAAAVPSVKLSGTVTAANDPNHLLGRPNQYTSKTTFTDSRIKAADVSGTKQGDVERGGAIEVFGSPGDAQARAKYIQAVTKSLPALAEYDYVHGTVLVRVSHYLTPAQAAGYENAAGGLS